MQVTRKLGYTHIRKVNFKTGKNERQRKVLHNDEGINTRRGYNAQHICS